MFFLALAASVQAEGSLILIPESKNFTLLVGKQEEFSLKILMDTFGQTAAGAGAKLNFDPTRLAGVEVIPGSIFGDYPTTAIDNTLGRITISGIASSLDDQYTGQGVLATIKWRALRPGNAKITFDFQPNSTTDSNIAVTTGSGDILSQVNQVNVNIVSRPVWSSLKPSSFPRGAEIHQLGQESAWSWWWLLIAAAVAAAGGYLLSKKGKPGKTRKLKR